MITPSTTMQIPITIPEMIDSMSSKPNTFSLSTQHLYLITGFGTLRRVWYWYKKRELYSNVDNKVKLSAGIAMNYALDHSPSLINTSIRIAAHLAYIASCIIEVAHRKQQLCLSQSNWYRSVRRVYYISFTQHVSWKTLSNQKQEYSFLSISTVIFCQVTLDKVYYRIHSIALASFRLCVSIFNFSMSFTDALESFQINPHNRNESVNEFFIHSGKIINELANNNKRLLEILQTNEKNINTIGKRLGYEYTAQQLINIVSMSTKVTEKAQSISHGTLNFFREALWGASQVLFGCAPEGLYPNEKKSGL